MSMPQHFFVVVISQQYEGGGELAAATAALFQRNWGGIRPYVIGSCTHYSIRPALARACLRRGVPVGNSISPSFLDPRRIDLWLGLDEGGIELARSIIKGRGPAPGGFYRHVFPEPVVAFGEPLPYPPPDEGQLDAWLDLLIPMLDPWIERIWAAFGDSS